MTDPVLGSIVLVEDEPQVNALFKRHLINKGYRVEEFFNAEDAIVRMDRGNSICLVLIDVTLPKMNGIDLAEWVRKAYPNVPIVFATGDPSRVSGPANTVVTKPLRDPKELTDVVWQQIKESMRKSEMLEVRGEVKELKQDFGLCLEKLGEVSEKLEAISRQHMETMAVTTAERATNDARLVAVSSQVAAAVRAAENASTKADNANVKVDGINFPGLVTGWRAKWDPLMTGVVTLLFMALSYLITEYKDQIIEKAIGVDKKVEVKIAQAKAEASAEIAKVRNEVGDMRTQYVNDSAENKRRQISMEVSQHALAHNMDKLLDRMNVPISERATQPVMRAVPTIARPR